jgi:hypothetical protein
MTGAELDRAIDFLLQQHARFMDEMQQLKEAQMRQQAETARQSEEIAQLKDVQEQHGGDHRLMTAQMREAFDNLIIANEVTRELAERIGKLALATSQRVTNLEQSQQ